MLREDSAEKRITNGGCYLVQWEAMVLDSNDHVRLARSVGPRPAWIHQHQGGRSVSQSCSTVPGGAKFTAPTPIPSGIQAPGARASRIDSVAMSMSYTRWHVPCLHGAPERRRQGRVRRRGVLLLLHLRGARARGGRRGRHGGRVEALLLLLLFVLLLVVVLVDGVDDAELLPPPAHLHAAPPLSPTPPVAGAAGLW
jgi:hypothetical protein